MEWLHVLSLVVGTPSASCASGIDDGGSHAHPSDMLRVQARCLKVIQMGEASLIDPASAQSIRIDAERCTASLVMPQRPG